MRTERVGTSSPHIMPRNAPKTIRTISPVSRFLPMTALGRARPMRYVRRGAIEWDVVVNARHLRSGGSRWNRLGSRRAGC
ncbi:hypothetical protein GA0115236_16165 [Streptomyces sp. IgraMP-1]|nr:hypothetical protein GA0115236_16165 [Streptomyces sp. IgraMP-1]